jgi:hypothetical protein
MSITMIIAIVAIVAVIALLAARGGGPRVTHIETRREKEDRKDADDA